MLRQNHKTFFTVHLLQDAIKSNKEFALKETQELIMGYLISDSPYNSHDGYELADVLCKQFCVEYPEELLGILHCCICETVRKKAQSGYYGFSTTKKLYRIDTENNYVGKILKMYEDLMIRYASDTLGRSFVLELLSLNNETTLSVAFAAMAEAPRQYDDQIRLLLEDNAKIGIYLRGDVEFFFLKMLKAWYETLNENDAERYQWAILSYKSEFDFKYDPERRWSQFLCPHLWRDKWALICNTLPKDLMIPEMKKCFQELLRRFGKKLMIEGQDHSVRVLYASDGVVDGEMYAKWPISNWLSSFLKLDEYKWRKGRVPVSLDQHAEAFKKCVSSLPENFTILC